MLGLGWAMPCRSRASERGEGGYGGKYKKRAILRNRALQARVDSAKSGFLASELYNTVLADDVYLDFSKIYCYQTTRHRELHKYTP